MLLSDKPIDIEQAVAKLYAQKAMIVLVKTGMSVELEVFEI